MHALGIEAPYIIILDNHKSHYGIEISKYCEEQQIHVIGLHPNSTFLAQPLDVALFRAFKAKWNGLLNRTGVQVKRTNVCSLVGTLMAENDFSDDIRSGFRASGLYPLDKNAIDKNKFIKSSSYKKLTPCVFGTDAPIYAQTSTQSLSLFDAKENSLNQQAESHETTLVNSLESTSTLVNSQSTSSSKEAQNQLESFLSTSPTELSFIHQVPVIDFDMDESNNASEPLKSNFQKQVAPEPNATHSQKLHFDSRFEFECAAKKMAFEVVREVYGSQITDLLDSGSFQLKSTNDFLISEVYYRLKPPSTATDALNSSMPCSKPNYFSDQNFAYSTLASRLKLMQPSEAQLKKAIEVEERKKQRDKKKLEKEELLKKEKEMKKLEKQREREEQMKRKEQERKEKADEKRKAEETNKRKMVGKGSKSRKRAKIHKNDENASPLKTEPHFYDSDEPFYGQLAESIQKCDY